MSTIETAWTRDVVSVVGPGIVWRQACEAGLVVRRVDPLNAETAMHALASETASGSASFFVRNHFQIPRLDEATYRLTVDGLVRQPLRLCVDDLRTMRVETRGVVLECAGNGRGLLHPSAPGESWTLGAVGSARWTGVPLVDILERAGVPGTAREVVFRGADRGSVGDAPDPLRFERSLSLEQVRTGRALLAYEMNGAPLPVRHGYPLRLIVPGWYGMASVKWLTEIQVAEQPFGGYFQRERYRYLVSREEGIAHEPVTVQRVRALITEPVAAQDVTGGHVAIRGVAWSGAAPVARVDVQVGRAGWLRAELDSPAPAQGWQRWQLLARVHERGPAILRARATDALGRTQQEQIEWNTLGYGNNAMHAVPIRLV